MCKFTWLSTGFPVLFSEERVQSSTRIVDSREFARSKPFSSLFFFKLFTFPLPPLPILPSYSFFYCLIRLFRCKRRLCSYQFSFWDCTKLLLLDFWRFHIDFCLVFLNLWLIIYIFHLYALWFTISFWHSAGLPICLRLYCNYALIKLLSPESALHSEQLTIWLFDARLSV